MDLVRILEQVSTDEEVTELAISEWFKFRREPEVARKMYTVLLKGTAGAQLRIPQLTSDEEEAVASAEKWANEHARFAQFGPWTGEVTEVED